MLKARKLGLAPVLLFIFFQPSINVFLLSEVEGRLLRPEINQCLQFLRKKEERVCFWFEKNKESNFAIFHFLDESFDHCHFEKGSLKILPKSFGQL